MAPKDSATPCNGVQSRDPRQSRWYRLSATKSDPKPDSEPKAATAIKRAAMAFGLDPARPSAADSQKAHLRTIKAAFGVSAPAASEAEHRHQSNLSRAYGLRQEK